VRSKGKLSYGLELFFSVFAAEVFQDDATAGKQLNDTKCSFRGIASRHELGAQNYFHPGPCPGIFAVAPISPTLSAETIILHYYCSYRAQRAGCYS